jgi:glucosamine-6-phosphate deaminase
VNAGGSSIPQYLKIPAAHLGRGQPVTVRVSRDAASLARDLAAAIFNEIRAGEQSGRGTTLILPVGPVDHFPLLAGMLNRRKVSCRNTVFINMDEYLTAAGCWVDLRHPLSFRAYMKRAFYELLDPALAPPPRQRVFPDPRDPGGIGELIAARGGVDACFGGIGINGHLAFNEPPEPGVKMSTARFAALPTRVLTLSRETCTINAVTVGGEIGVIPRRAITVGMREILGARRLRIYCNRPWQSGVVRRALHGPLTPACPASFLRTHPDASVTMTRLVAEAPNIRLR